MTSKQILPRFFLLPLHHIWYLPLSILNEFILKIQFGAQSQPEIWSSQKKKEHDDIESIQTFKAFSFFPIKFSITSSQKIFATKTREEKYSDIKIGDLDLVFFELLHVLYIWSHLRLAILSSWNSRFVWVPSKLKISRSFCVSPSQKALAASSASRYTCCILKTKYYV